MDKEKSSRISKSIDGYIKGKLNSKEIDRLWIQLLENPEYYPLLKTEVNLHKYYREQHQIKKSPRTGLSVLRANRVWIASVAAVFLIALFIYLFRFPSESEIQPYFTDISNLYLISPDVTRSTSESMNEFEQALNRSLQYSVTGNFSESISIYHNLLDTSDSSEVQSILNYNLGISYYNTGEYSLSARHFKRANCRELKNPAYIESCYWLRTNSLLAIQEYSAAFESAQMTRDMNGSYADKANEILNKLPDFQ